MHMDRTSITSWELGRHTPDIETTSQLAEVLGVKVTSLMVTAEESGEAPNVLLVDDKPIILKGGVLTLREVMPNANVIGFTEPTDVMSFFKSNPVALIFLDIEMGITNGLDLCREMLRLSPRTNVIYLTAYPEYSLGAWETGASGFLVKPLMPADVLAIIPKLKHPIQGNIFQSGEVMNK